jgi:hypothetical protein
MGMTEHEDLMLSQDEMIRLSRRSVDLSDQLDFEGISPFLQVPLLCSALTLALLAIPIEARRAIVESHIEAMRTTLDYFAAANPLRPKDTRQ